MYETLAALLIEEFGCEPDAVTPEATFRRLELDSLSLAELAVLVADRTGVLVEDSDLGLDTTLGRAAAEFTAASTVPFPPSPPAGSAA
ncbi:acyl carrier protein [Streptomyces avicenniae]|uniref:acyl carrier protein n=1 Tax=Streptomyces avicenniae TaxID=500153 RepID=UPI00069CB9ED|nr:acyl carrier protein [Streptomyces avicenniae]